MTSGPIDLEAERQKRVFAEMDADEEGWERLRDDIEAVLVKSGRSDISIVTATLNALLGVLQEDYAKTPLESVEHIKNDLEFFRWVTELEQRRADNQPKSTTWVGADSPHSSIEDGSSGQC